MERMQEVIQIVKKIPECSCEEEMKWLIVWALTVVVISFLGKMCCYV